MQPPCGAVARPALDTSGEVWVGTLPGLGAVEVDPDGTIRTFPDGPDLERVRAVALEAGWGELLATSRRGLTLVSGAAFVALADESVLVCGSAHDVALVGLGLVRRRWSLVSDHPTPVELGPEAILAHPRSAPMVVGAERATLAGFSGVPVREGSNSMAVDVPRHTQPTRVSAIVHVEWRRQGDAILTALTGVDRFEAAARTIVNGAVAPDADESSLDAHLQLAAPPAAMLRIEADASESAIEALVDWIAAQHPRDPAAKE